MKKRLVIILAAFAAVITVCLAFFILYKPSYYRLYADDRIKGEITVSIDGQSAQFDEERTRKYFNYEGDFFTEDYTATISLKAGDYGPYDFSVYVVGLDQPLQLSVWQLNWWNVKTFRLDVSMDIAKRIAHITCFTTNISEDEHVYEEERTWDLELTNEGMTIVFD
ncbi:hypothetical protein IMSAG013_00711 [Clostridiales bacterium]|nr:hypothetical protein IMSAG013_00711 [Clostridiales bacterium]